MAVAAVRTATAAVGSAHADFVLRQTTIGIPDQPDDTTEISAEGVVDIDAHRGRFRLDRSGFDTALEQAFHQPTDFIVDGDTGYFRSASTDAPEDEKWRRLPPDAGVRLVGMVAADASFITGLGLDVLGLGEPSGVENLGRKEVRGTSTSHYRVTVDPSEDDVEDVRLRAALANGEPFVYDVWVDDADRMRRMSYRVDLTASTKDLFEDFQSRTDGTATTFPADMSLLGEVKIELWDFGESVDIEVPPPDQIRPDP